MADKKNLEIQESKKSSHYLSGREIRAISKANAKVMKKLEDYKNRKAPESEFTTELKDSKNILEIDNLHTYFFTEQGVVKAVNGVSYNVPKNAVVGVVGESGCGKSTLGRTILQLYDQTAGSTMYYGRTIDDFAPSYVGATLKNASKMLSAYKKLKSKAEQCAAICEEAGEEIINEIVNIIKPRM